MRITKTGLLARVRQLNEMLGRPTAQFASKLGEPVKFSVGHLVLEHSGTYGYNLEEQISNSGAVNVLCSGKTANEMDNFLSGMIRGIAFRNVQIARRVLLTQLPNPGLKPLNVPVYSPDAPLDEPANVQAGPTAAPQP